jgi:hypothetical protein
VSAKSVVVGVSRVDAGRDLPPPVHKPEAITATIALQFLNTDFPKSSLCSETHSETLFIWVHMLARTSPLTLRPLNTP